MAFAVSLSLAASWGLAVCPEAWRVVFAGARRVVLESWKFVALLALLMSPPSAAPNVAASLAVAWAWSAGDF
ncbi:MAG: hypothetical protein ACPIOQ_50915, partial [Promethearchaeia archaeon]